LTTIAPTCLQESLSIIAIVWIAQSKNGEHLRGESDQDEVKHQENSQIVHYVGQHHNNRGKERKDPQEEESFHNKKHDNNAHHYPAIDISRSKS
jgi:hypothetical protein